MGFDVKTLFEDADFLSNVHSKKEYESNTKVFRSNNRAIIDSIYEAIDSAEDKTEAIDKTAKELTQATFDLYEKRGKIKIGKLTNLNYFMIYYIFPCFLAERPEDGTEICEAMKTAWNTVMPKTNIGYTDYETLLDGFQTKIFGIPIGKN